MNQMNGLVNRVDRFSAEREEPVPVEHDDVPPSVARALGFFRDRRIWHVTSRNPPVGSCREAAANRRRQGRVGIPVSDELKSLLYSYRHRRQRLFTLLHCRGNQRIDLWKVTTILGSEPEPVARLELAAEFGATYGTVTPALFTDRGDLWHIVDSAVLERSGPPFTMMTNAGHHEYAVEFRPDQLFAALPQTVVRDIAVPRSS